MLHYGALSRLTSTWRERGDDRECHSQDATRGVVHTAVPSNKSKWSLIRGVDACQGDSNFAAYISIFNVRGTNIIQ